MGSLVSLFSRLDAVIQRRFDSIYFFLMRRFGVRKSAIRYALNALAVIAFTGDFVSDMRYGVASALGVFLGGFFILVLLLQQHMDARDDREAEAAPGVASAADRDPGHGIWKIVIAAFLFTTLLEFRYPPSAYLKAGLNGGEHIFQTICDTVFWLAYLASAYLRKTPMNPPAEKEKTSVFDLQTAPAKT
jgi:hypothetical protein